MINKVCLLLVAASLTIGTTFSLSQGLAEPDLIIQQAADLVAEGRPNDGIEVLFDAYWETSNIEDKVRLYNSILSYHYDLSDYESVRILAQNAINRDAIEDQEYFRYHSKAYGYLAKVLIEVDNDTLSALPYLRTCDRGKQSDLEQWCEDERKHIEETRRSSAMGILSHQLEQSYFSFLLTVLITFIGIIVFAYRILFSKSIYSRK